MAKKPSKKKAPAKKPAPKLSDAERLNQRNAHRRTEKKVTDE